MCTQLERDKLSLMKMVELWMNLKKVSISDEFRGVNLDRRFCRPIDETRALLQIKDNRVKSEMNELRVVA